MEYPKPLPALGYKTIELETGFYLNEVVALQNGWRLIKRSLVKHSTILSINFFSENFLLLEKFRDTETRKINLSILHQHVHQIMKIYGRLIESDLSDVNVINILLNDVKNVHKLYSINIDDIKLIIHFIKQYILVFLDKVKSTAFENGFNKLSELIIEHHKENTEETRFQAKKND